MSKQQIISDWFHQYSDDIYHFLIYRMGYVDVEDVVQEVFIRAIKGLDSFQGDSHPKTWLFTIARNTAVDEIRKRSRNKWKSYLTFDAKQEPIVEETPEKIIESSEENKELYLAIQSLKTNYREVVILRGIKDLSVKETSLILNWSENKVRSTFHRAKKVLQKELQTELGGIYSEQ
ncbi:RNA polymerase sigma factor [Evansella sp. AB-P1]|uniref:RNA polymerase sigma factor n=1 Tax=Evansella sp. AB-P1 TaxID=3037653 RepID=UPI00241F7165|nr:RNA polymerase sigma factor [Evansella sp. AB-P1]MDG5788835.1 RNA polymerase sigma factor [Evansella sp. AB-P1]